MSRDKFRRSSRPSRQGDFMYRTGAWGARAALGNKRRRRLVKRVVFGPFGLFGPFGPFSPVGPLKLLRLRGAWKYAAAVGAVGATAGAVARGFDGASVRQRFSVVRPWERWRDESRGRADDGALARRRDAHVKDRDREMEEDTMPRFGGHGFPGFEKPNGRRFDRGDVKYVLLDLLREGPRHGYDMIKELEKRSDGLYSPSPGSIYPTLQMLEDQGLVTSTTVEGKRTYRLTDAGYAFMEDRPKRTDDARGRAWAEGFGEGGDGLRDEFRSVGREAGELARSLREAVRSYTPDSRQVGEIRDVIGETRKRIEAILAERRDAPRDENSNKPTTV